MKLLTRLLQTIVGVCGIGFLAAAIIIVLAVFQDNATVRGGGIALIFISIVTGVFAFVGASAADLADSDRRRDRLRDREQELKQKESDFQHYQWKEQGQLSMRVNDLDRREANLKRSEEWLSRFNAQAGTPQH